MAGVRVVVVVVAVVVGVRVVVEEVEGEERRCPSSWALAAEELTPSIKQYSMRIFLPVLAT